MLFRLPNRRLAASFLVLAGCAIASAQPPSVDVGQTIDQVLAGAHQTAGITAAPRCDDRTFLRRATLDLAGRVPTTHEIHRFDASNDRAALVARLLASPDFARHWSGLWTTILIGRSAKNRTEREALQVWLEQQFARSVPLDQIAFDLISADGVTAIDGPVNFMVAHIDDPVTPISRIFLGVQLDCAQCHDHPYDRWTQDDHAAMQRFFRGVRVREVSGGFQLLGSGSKDIRSLDANHPDHPRFLTGARPRTAAWRRELALMTVRSKPFARAMGNRIWQLLFGAGLVDPVDGLSQENLAVIPELHQLLADQLAANRFDVRSLVRAICASDAYSRSILASDDGASTWFASRMLRPLSPEQLVASESVILGQPVPEIRELNRRAIGLVGRSDADESTTDPLRDDRTSQGLLDELSGPMPPATGDLDSMFQATLLRSPEPWERDVFADVNSADVLYTLLHCNEFVFCQ